MPGHPASDTDTDTERSLGAVDAELLKRRLRELAGHIHAAQAEMIELLAQLDDCDGWTGIGLRSIGHWASIELGLDARTTAARVRAARRLRELPAIADAARSGELGWAKVDLVAQVAEPDSDDDWLDLARKLSVGQLRRTTRAYQRAERDGDRPDPDTQPGRRRGIWLFDEPDGLVRVAALLEADDAAVLKAALNAQLERNWRAHRSSDNDEDAGARGAGVDTTAPEADPTANGGSAPVGQPSDATSDGKATSAGGSTVGGSQIGAAARQTGDRGNPDTVDADSLTETRAADSRDTRVDDPARRDEIEPARQTRDPIGARRADALIDLLRASLTAPDKPDLVDDSTEVIVHVDLAFLTGDSPVGRCHTNHGDPLPRDAARRAACDALIRPLLHDGNGTTLDLGRSARTPNRAQRRALARRDNSCCTFPGCTTTVGLAAHHIRHWTDGGPTDIDNMALLCRYHHKLHQRPEHHRHGRRPTPVLPTRRTTGRPTRTTPTRPPPRLHRTARPARPQRARHRPRHRPRPRRRRHRLVPLPHPRRPLRHQDRRVIVSSSCTSSRPPTD